MEVSEFLLHLWTTWTLDENLLLEEEKGAGPSQQRSHIKNKESTETTQTTEDYIRNPNLDLIARMFGKANEAKVEGNGVSSTCLVDTGATVTVINHNL